MRLIFNNEDWDKGCYYPLFPDDGSMLFTDVIACLEGGITGRGDEDPETASRITCITRQYQRIMLPCVQPYCTSKAKTERVMKGVTLVFYMSKKISPTPHSDVTAAMPC